MNTMLWTVYKLYHPELRKFARGGADLTLEHNWTAEGRTYTKKGITNVLDRLTPELKGRD